MTLLKTTTYTADGSSERVSHRRYASQKSARAALKRWLADNDHHVVEYAKLDVAEIYTGSHFIQVEVI